MKNLKEVFVSLLLIFSVSSIAQTAESTSEIIFVDYSAKSSATVITIISPDNLMEVTRGFTPVKGSKMELIGTVEDPDGIRQLRINDQIVVPGIDGSFMTTLVLPTGDQKIIVKVTDGKGNETVRTFAVQVEDAPMMAGLTTEIGSYYALLIGIDDYQDPELNDLSNAVADANELGQVLEQNYYFKHENVVLLENATRRSIIEALDELGKKLTSNDNLLIFYAGHGWWDKDSEVGYWIPSDGRKNSTADWFGNSTLTDKLRSIKSKHTLLIADACFSGGIFKTRTAFTDAAPAINKLYAMPSRKAMTSGTLTVVPDNSVFIRYLIKRLESNTQKYLPSEQLFSSFRMAVINNSDVVPQYGIIQKVGDEGGDFIFIKRD